MSGARVLFPLADLECYTITVIDPLSPTAGAPARLILAAAVLAAVWLAVYWAAA